MVLGALSVSMRAVEILTRECRLRGIKPVALLFDERAFLRRDVGQMELDSRAPRFWEIFHGYRRLGVQVRAVPGPSRGHADPFARIRRLEALGGGSG